MLAEEHDQMKERAELEKEKDRKIIKACKEQISKLKLLVQIKTDVVSNERKLKSELADMRYKYEQAELHAKQIQSENEAKSK